MAERFYYKKVARVGERLFSVYAGESYEFFLGTEISQRARKRHQGGFFVCETFEEALNTEFSFKPGGFYGAPHVVLECSCRGPFVRYGAKIACSHLRPLRIVTEGQLNAILREPPLEERPRPVRASVSMREETRCLEDEVRELERRLGYRR